MVSWCIRGYCGCHSLSVRAIIFRPQWGPCAVDLTHFQSHELLVCGVRHLQAMSLSLIHWMSLHCNPLLILLWFAHLPHYGEKRCVSDPCWTAQSGGLKRWFHNVVKFNQFQENQEIWLLHHSVFHHLEIFLGLFHHPLKLEVWWEIMTHVLGNVVKLK